MTKFDDAKEENIKEKNSSTLPQNPDYPSRILWTDGSGSGKENTFLNLISHQPDIGKIHLYAKIHFNQDINY